MTTTTPTETTSPAEMRGVTIRALESSIAEMRRLIPMAQVFEFRPGGSAGQITDRLVQLAGDLDALATALHGRGIRGEG